MNVLPHTVVARPAEAGWLQALTRLWQFLVQALRSTVAPRTTAGIGDRLRRPADAPAPRRAATVAVTTRAPEGHRLLGVVTADELSRRLADRGVFAALDDRGFEHLEVVLEPSSFGSRARVFGEAGGARSILVELVVERRAVADRPRLYIQWLLLQRPGARFRNDRPALPGQEAPGLGVSTRILALLGELARELGLAGIAYRPSWYHIAYRMRRRFVFADPARQARFEALQQSLVGLSLAEASRVVHEGRVRLDGQAYAWEPDAMIERAPDEQPAHRGVTAPAPRRARTRPPSEDAARPAA